MQPIEVLDMINETGQYIPEPSKMDFIKDEEFKKAYDWLVVKMHERIDNNITDYPVWAWRKYNNKIKQPDLRHRGYAPRGTELACIEVEIEDKNVVLTDFDTWHLIINDMYCSRETDPDLIEKDYDWFDTLDTEIQEKLKLESWNDTFNVSKSDYIQACFFTLRKEDIVSVKIFKAK